jgi:hypothetical protein
MEKGNGYITISPGDFIHGPYIQCPKCGKDTFGVLMIRDDHYCRRCRDCFYPGGHERAATYPLPPLNKKIIYIDQFAISNMMISLNPATKAHQKGRVDPFWNALFAKLDSLSKLQLIICPDSDFHEDESLLAPFYRPLKRMYELLSHGVSFYDHETIQRYQIIGQLKVWLGESKTLDLDVHRLVHGKINAWQERFIISAGNAGWPELIQEIRSNRKKIEEALLPVFKRWQKEKDKDFNYWYEEERKARGQVLVELYQRQLRYFALASLDPASFHVGELLPNMAMITIQEIKDNLKRHGVKEEDLNTKLGEFLRSDAFENAPFIKISSMLYAATARKAASGRRKPPNKGFMTDVKILSTLLPYCDAMFIDNECRGFLSEKPLCDEINYGTRIYSYATREDFLKYLDGTRFKASKELLEKVEEVYGPAWGKPFTELYRI